MAGELELSDVEHYNKTGIKAEQIVATSSACYLTDLNSEWHLVQGAVLQSSRRWCVLLVHHPVVHVHVAG